MARGRISLASARPNVWSQKWNYEAKTSLQHLISRLTSRLIVSWQISQRTSSVGAQNTLTISLQSTVGIQTVSGGQISGAITIIGLSGFKDATGQIVVTNQGYNTVAGLFVGNTAKSPHPKKLLILPFPFTPSPSLPFAFSLLTRN